MLINLLIYAVVAAFSAYVIVSACSKYIGYNPQAPSLWKRVKAWWPGFVKRHIVDDDPYQDESHAGTRYAENQGHRHNLPLGVITGGASSLVDGVTGFPRNTCPHCDAPIHAGEYIDWSKVPDGLDWASAAHGSVCLWKHRPYASEESEMYNSLLEIYTPATQPAIIGTLPPWRDSLRHRPGK